MKKYRILSCFLAIVTALTLWVPLVPAYAAESTEQILKKTAYDITGDGNKDTIVVEAVKSTSSSAAYTYSAVRVTVNGNSAFNSPSLAGNEVTARVISLKSGKIYLLIESQGANDYISSNLCQYNSKENKFEFVLRGDNMIQTKNATNDGYRDSGNGVYLKTKDDTIYYTVQVTSPSIGTYTCKVPYTYQDGKLVKGDSAYVITSVSSKRSDSKLKAAREIKAYNAPNGKKIAVLTKGKTYLPDRVYIKKTVNNNYFVYYRVPVTINKTKKNVWINGIYFKDVTNADKVLFKGIVLAG